MFRFAKYRDIYPKHLLTATRRFNISVLAHVVTSEYTHLPVATGDRGCPEVSEAPQHVHGEVGQHYNMARKREGSRVATAQCWRSFGSLRRFRRLSPFGRRRLSGYSGDSSGN